MTLHVIRRNKVECNKGWKGARLSYEQTNSKAAHVGRSSLKIQPVLVKLKLKRLYLLFSSLKFSKMSWNVYQIHFPAYLIKCSWLNGTRRELNPERGTIVRAVFKYAFLISFLGTIINLKCPKWITVWKLYSANTIGRPEVYLCVHVREV